MRAVGQGGAVDLLERVIKLAIVEGGVGLAEGRSVAGVKSGIPLAVLIAEADDDNVGGTDQRLSADRVDARAPM